jgi:zinc protease
MNRFLSAVLLTMLVSGLGSPGRAEGDKNATAILDKGIKALGGEEKLKAIKAVTWKAKGTININDNDSEFTSEVTMQGLDHFRQIFELDFNGEKRKGVFVVSGDKGWRKFGDTGGELDKEALAPQKRGVYLQLIPVTLVPLKGKGFKLKVAGEEKVGDKPAVVLTVTPPEGKDFTLYFDKESGLPVKEVAEVVDLMGKTVTQETTYDGYKELGGIKKATKIAAKRDGKKFLEQEITEFKPLDKVDPKTFAEPE